MAAAHSPRNAAPLRILTAVPVCDGHDSAVTTINIELARHGIEVIYLGYHQTVAAIVRAAIQEDVNVVGLSSYNGGHIVFFKEVCDQLRKSGNGDIPVFGGGGGTITHADERVMKRQGTDRIYFAGTPLDAMMAEIKRDYARTARMNKKLKGDRALARAITIAEARLDHRPQPKPLAAPKRRSREGGFIVGVAGPGGAGKSTLIDELTSRFLRQNPAGRIALLANDPSHPDSGGAILGDRVSALYAQDDRVFFRSLATRGSLTGLSAAAPAAIDILKNSGEFDLIFVESVGVGQESDPFRIFGKGPKLVERHALRPRALLRRSHPAPKNRPPQRRRPRGAQQVRPPDGPHGQGRDPGPPRPERQGPDPAPDDCREALRSGRQHPLRRHRAARRAG